ncbi:MAG TPA: hypothetical protein VFX50_15745, partial [Gemmatimonadales bacterium]|nr:hypothetical protein [Gemmatimonadales bacterium]
MRRSLSTVLVLCSVLLAGACVTTAGPSPKASEPRLPEADDMSASDHRREAAKHERWARDIESGTPAGVVRFGFPVVGSINRDPQQAAEMAPEGETTVDPGFLAESDAGAERNLARAHLAAAEELERHVETA